MTYITLKKNLTPLYVREKMSSSRGLGKKILAQTKSPIPPSPTKVKWANTQAVGKKPANLTPLVDVIRQQNGCSAFIMWWFSRLLKILLSRLKIRSKRHKLKEKVQKSALIPFCGQTRAFRYEIVFRGIQPYLFYTFQSYP